MRKFLSRIKYLVVKQFNILALLLSGKYFSNKKKILGLKDLHKGKRCFIICNGPSLRPEDLTKIHEAGDVSIGMNMIARIYDKTPWRADYLLATDGICFKERNRDLVFNNKAKITFCNMSMFLKMPSLPGKKIFLNLKNSRTLLDKPKFSEKAEDYLYSIGTTTFEAIELAKYIGCSEVYILGCDMSYAVNIDKQGRIYYSESGKNHFYKKENDIVSHVTPYPTWEMEAAYDFAEKYSRSNNFRIFNATRGGMLDCFERVDFDSLFID